MADKEFKNNWDKEIEKLTQEQIDNYYQKGITDGLSNEQRAHLYFSAYDNDYADIMGADDFIDNTPTNVVDDVAPASVVDEVDENVILVAKQKGVNPKMLGALVGRLGAGALDPVSEALEVALGKVGLGKIAKGWIQGEVLNLMAGVLRGAAKGGGEFLGQTVGPAVMNLSAGREVVQGSPEPGIDALIAGMEGFADQMELSPSYQLDEAVNKVTGKYGNEWLVQGAKRIKGIFNEG